MPQIGELQVELTLNSNLGSGVAQARGELGQLDQSIQKTSENSSILDAATGRNARGIKSMGTVAMMAGGPLMLMGMSMREAGGEAAKVAPIIQTVATALTAFGSVAAILPPIIRSIGFAHTAIIPAIVAHTKAEVIDTAATVANTVATVAGAKATAVNVAAKTAELSISELVAAETAQIAAATVANTVATVAGAKATAVNVAAKTAELSISELVAAATSQVAAANVAAMTVEQLAAVSTAQLTMARAAAIPVIEAQAVATEALAVTETAAAGSTGILSTAIGLLGGPVGVAVVAGVAIAGIAAALILTADKGAAAITSFETQESKLKAAKDAADKYTSSLSDLQNMQSKLVGIPGDIRETKRQIEENAIAVTRTEREWGDMDKKGMRTTPEEQENWRLKGIELNRLRDKGEELQLKLKEQEKEAMYLPSQVSEQAQKTGMEDLYRKSVSNAPVVKPASWDNLFGIIPTGAKYGYDTGMATTSKTGFSMEKSTEPNIPQVSFYVNTLNVNDKQTWDGIIKDSTTGGFALRSGGIQNGNLI